MSDRELTNDEQKRKGKKMSDTMNKTIAPD